VAAFRISVERSWTRPTAIRQVGWGMQSRESVREAYHRQALARHEDSRPEEPAPVTRTNEYGRETCCKSTLVYPVGIKTSISVVEEQVATKSR
jgi:hypothetical protein